MKDTSSDGTVCQRLWKWHSPAVKRLSAQWMRKATKKMNLTLFASNHHRSDRKHQIVIRSKTRKTILAIKPKMHEYCLWKVYSTQLYKNIFASHKLNYVLILQAVHVCNRCYINEILRYMKESTIQGDWKQCSQASKRILFKIESDRKKVLCT